MILLTPLYTDNILGVKDNGTQTMHLMILRQLVKQSMSIDLSSDDETIRPVTSTPVRHQKPATENHIDMLLSIITAVTNCVAMGITEDDNGIIRDLLQCKRPQHMFFSRVYRKPDNDLPAGVLATYCDVAVVKFFNRCNGYSSHHAVEWCLQYLIKMFATLDPLLQSSGSGWYNAKMKVRKGSSIANAPILPLSNDQVGGAVVSCDQGAQPHRRKSGCVDYSKLDMSQLNDNSTSLPVSINDNSISLSRVEPTITLDSYTSPAQVAVIPNPLSNRRRSTFRPPSMVPIAEEPPDIISSNTIDMSIVRFSPDLTEPCNYGNDPLVCMPQPDSVPTSPTNSYNEAEEISDAKKSVRFDETDEEVDLIEYELQTGVSYEGRIGLVAILNAIAKLPVKTTNKIFDEKITGKPSDEISLWNETVCKKVFLLIQKCINSSMFIEQNDDVVEDTSVDETLNSASYKRRAFRLKRTKPKRNVQQKSRLAIYSGHVMQYAFQAIAQCALFIHCTVQNCTKQQIKDIALCNELHEKLLAIFTHSGGAFKRYLQNFVKNESVEKVLSFLHATLGFCTSATNDDKLGYRYEYKVKIVVSVLKDLIDKVLCLDWTESSIKMV